MFVSTRLPPLPQLPDAVNPLIVFLAFLGWAGYRLQKKVEEFETPTLKITLEEGKPYVERTFNSEGREISRLFRVGVQNTSGTAVDAVVVRLEACEPPEQGIGLGAELHLMHDNPDYRGPMLRGRIISPNDPPLPPYQTTFHLNPRSTQYADLVSGLVTSGEQAYFELHFARRGLKGLLPAGRYRLTVNAGGRNSAPARIFLVADVVDGFLHVEPVNERSLRTSRSPI